MGNDHTCKAFLRCGYACVATSFVCFEMKMDKYHISELFWICDLQRNFSAPRGLRVFFSVFMCWSESSTMWRKGELPLVSPSSISGLDFDSLLKQEIFMVPSFSIETFSSWSLTNSSDLFFSMLRIQFADYSTSFRAEARVLFWRVGLNE